MYNYQIEDILKKINVLLLVAIMVFVSCATKIPFEQTCLTCVQSQRINCKGDDCPQTVMVGSNCIAIMDETGEKINMNYILTQEKIQITGGIPLTIAKIRGRYFVAGKMFRNLWILTPCENEARVKFIPFPMNVIDEAPIFEITGDNLLIKDANNRYAFEYDIDAKKWINQKARAGE